MLQSLASSFVTIASLFLFVLVAFTESEMVCDKDPVYLTALPEQQLLVSSQYENMCENTATCKWVITTDNASDAVQFKLIHWFAPPTTDCSKDYVITRDGSEQWARRLRIWCQGYKFHDELVKTRTNTLTVQLVSDIYWDDRIVFVMAFWTAPVDVELVKPLTLGAANYVLIVFSALLGLVLTAGLSVLIFKEIVRARDAKNMEFRQKLNVRRKGISGISYVRTKSPDDSTIECTSYIELSETPTSIRCSSAWTPSPDTACASETTTSGNFSL